MNLFEYIVVSWSVSAAIMWVILLWRRRSQVFDRKLWNRDTIGLIQTRTLSAFGFSGALAAGAVLSVSSYISSLGLILIIIFGVLFLHERDYLRRKVTAAVLAFAGFTAILISNLKF